MFHLDVFLRSVLRIRLLEFVFILELQATIAQLRGTPSRCIRSIWKLRRLMLLLLHGCRSCVFLQRRKIVSIIQRLDAYRGGVRRILLRHTSVTSWQSLSFSLALSDIKFYKFNDKFYERVARG